MSTFLLLFFLSLLTITSAIYNGGRRRGGYRSDSWSSSSDESFEGHHHHHHSHSDEHYPPPRPRPPPRQQCQDGWKFFERPSGGWCMKVFPGTWNQATSESMCQAQGAVLSGMQNIAEINYIVSSALTVISPAVSGGVWVGIKRRSECMGQLLTGTCTKTNSFYWTDDSTTGIEGIVFQLNEPNNGNAPPGPNRNQDCALLTVAHTPTINAVSMYWSGQMDDISCASEAASNWPAGTLPRANRAYVCGKAANRRG
ncbi:unnamed protein product [Caenorhabditis nigoni]